MSKEDPRDPADRTDQADLTDLTDRERWALYAPWLEHTDPAVRANALVCLINQANFLLDQQIGPPNASFRVWEPSPRLRSSSWRAEVTVNGWQGERDGVRYSSQPQPPDDPLRCS